MFADFFVLILDFNSISSNFNSISSHFNALAHTLIALTHLISTEKLQRLQRSVCPDHYCPRFVFIISALILEIFKLQNTGKSFFFKPALKS